MTEMFKRPKCSAKMTGMFQLKKQRQTAFQTRMSILFHVPGYFKMIYISLLQGNNCILTGHELITTTL